MKPITREMIKIYGIKDFDFYEEVDYFFDIVYGLDR